MAFSDIFKKSFLEGFTAKDINLYTISTAILITCVLAFYIFVVYRVLTRKTFYSKNFNIALACIAVITCGIVLTVQGSIAISLGMVGALSIVRFRTAVKDPLDLMFLFWSVAIGIICGSGMAEIAIILSIVLTAGTLLLNVLPIAKAPLILVVNTAKLNAEEEIMAIVKGYAKHCSVKTKNSTEAALELIIELRTCNGSNLIQDLLRSELVVSASLMSHDGEVTF